MAAYWDAVNKRDDENDPDPDELDRRAEQESLIATAREGVARQREYDAIVERERFLQWSGEVELDEVELIEEELRG